MQAGSATSVNGLYYTGVNNSGGLLGGGTTDSHWAVTYAYANGTSGNTTYQGQSYVVSGSYIDPGWVANTSFAQWIVAPGAQNLSGTVNVGGDILPGAGTSGNNRGTYVYTLAFNVGGTGTGTVTNHIDISLTLAADDQAKVYINPTLNASGSVNSGSLLGGALYSAWNNTSALNLHNYNNGTAANANFVIGTNYLVIQVDNTDSLTGIQAAHLNPSGLLVYQTGTAILIDGQPVPEVGVWLPIAGALGLVFWQRRRPSQKPLSIA